MLRNYLVGAFSNNGGVVPGAAVGKTEFGHLSAIQIIEREQER